MRPHVTRIESNAKGGAVAELGPRTLILGRNGTGKSALVNAIELAGTGRVSDVAGRDTLAKAEELSTLGPPGAQIWARAELSDGSVASWELAPGRRPHRGGVALAFPLRDVREALTGSPETARKWLLERAGATAFQWPEVVESVPEMARARLAQVAGSSDTGSPAAARLVAALEGARREARDATARGKGSRVPAPARPPSTDLEIEAATVEVALGEKLPEREAQLSEAHAQVARLEGEARRIEYEISTLPAPRADQSLARSVLLVMDALLGAGLSECVICGGRLDAITLGARAARGRAGLAAVTVEARRREGLSFALREVVADLGRARKVRESIEAQIRGTGLATDVALPARAPRLSLPDARRCLAELHTCRAGWEAHRRGEERAILAEREATEWTQLAVILSRTLGQLVERGRRAFEASAQAFLPTGDVFGLDLEEQPAGDASASPRAVARVGLRRTLGAEGHSESRTVLHSALSGAEWARVTAAIALAALPPAPAPAIVVPEERAFDPETLSAVLAALGRGLAGMPADEAPQLLVTSPVEPSAVPDGWTVIRLGDVA